MASSDRTIGKGSYVSFNGNDLSTMFVSGQYSENVALHQITAGDEGNHLYKAGIKDGTATVTFRIEGAPGFSVGDEGSLIIGVEGNSTGDVRDTVNAFCQSLEKGAQYDGGALDYVATFQYSGAVTTDTFA